MFSVYGASGRLFRGTLEQLRQIGPVHSVDRTRSVEPVWRDERDDSPSPPPAHRAEPESGRHREAMAAYARPRPPAGLRWSTTPVGDVMRRDVFTLAATDLVADAWQQLAQRRFAQAPVVNPEGVLVGLVAMSRLAALLPGSAVARPGIGAVRIADAMLTPVAGVAAEADLRRVAGLLLEAALPALPVVDDDGRVIGLVTRGDVLRAVLADSAIDQWG